MNSVQIEENVKDLVQNISNQSVSRNNFVYELLLAYGHRKSVISRVKSGERNLSKNSGEVILKRHLYFKPCTTNLFAEIDELKKSKTTSSNKIRFVVVTDFNQLIAVDTKTQDTLDIELNQLSKHFDFFLPWAGMEKMVYRGENPADVKAAEKMADFFDHIKELNYPSNASKEQLHDLVVFLNRMLFCFFAEDTKIFGDNQFTNLLNQHTSEDGSDVASTFQRLFEVLNTAAHQRGALPEYLSRFPYVNGGLFKKEITIPVFDGKARRMLLDSGQLDWSDINPDIFGSMIQGVADPETRSKMGMHYTSVTNIMKVIEPLFLNDFYDEFEKSTDNINKLRKLQVRLSRIKIFDPACGSGNFLIIAYKEIRLLEIEILKRIRELEGESDSGSLGLFDESHSSIRLDQFYGIELDDFAHEMAILSLWLVEHQMNMVFETEFGYTAPTLPLKQSGRIVAGNATIIDWELVCPRTDLDETFVLGNPPYLGFSQQTTEQKSDIKRVWGKAKKVDYLTCWLYKAANFIKSTNSSVAFVSTNSICQGEQVSLVWPDIFSLGVEIPFCVTSFQWKNNAKDKAGVYCIVIALQNGTTKEKQIFSDTSVKKVKHINAYLTEGQSVTVAKRRTPLSSLPTMTLGEMAKDGGYLFLSAEERESILNSDPSAQKFIKSVAGAEEFIRGKKRWCIWVSENEYDEAKMIPFFADRFEGVKQSRLASAKKATQEYALKPYRFVEVRNKDTFKILVPTVSSSRRDYVPIGYFDEDTIVNAPNNVLYAPEPFIFGLIHSRMHMAWLKAVGGRLKTDYRYSVALVYNTFPFPTISESQKDNITDITYKILECREDHPNKSIAELYDPELMPSDLEKLHDELDRCIELCYENKTYSNDEERLQVLFKHFETLSEGENA